MAIRAKSTADLPPSTAEGSTERSHCAKPTDFGLGVTFDLAGAEWPQVNALHAQYEFHKHWPDGMLCHITGITTNGVLSHGVWTNERDEAAYFRDVAIPIITDAVDEIGAARGAESTWDFEPVSRALHDLTLGPGVAAFVDIGADADASAIDVLGSRPVAIDLDLNEIADVAVERMRSQLEYDDSTPCDLIMSFEESSTDGDRLQTQIWSSADAANAFLKNVAIPLRSDGSNLRPLKRISFGSSSMNPNWFA
jgi:hypothetical protein